MNQLFVYGNGHYNHLVAIAVVSKSDEGGEVINGDLRMSENLLKKFCEVILEVSPGLKSGCPMYVLVTTELWTAENGLVTPAGKLSRPHLHEKYAEYLTEMLEYGNSAAESTIAPSVVDKCIDLLRGGGSQLEWEVIGLDSISAVQCVSRIRQVVGVEVPVTALLDGNTLRQLQHFVQGTEELPTTEVDWSAETVLDEDVRASSHDSDNFFSSDDNISEDNLELPNVSVARPS